MPGWPIVSVHAREAENGLVGGVAHETYALVVEFEAAGLSGRPAPELVGELAVIVHVAGPPVDVA